MSELRITLEAARVNARLKQKEAADRIGVTQQTLLNWEKGRTVPTIEHAIKMCEVYGVDLDHLNFFKPESIINGARE